MRSLADKPIKALKSVLNLCHTHLAAKEVVGDGHPNQGRLGFQTRNPPQAKGCQPVAHEGIVEVILGLQRAQDS